MRQRSQNAVQAQPLGKGYHRKRNQSANDHDQRSYKVNHSVGAGDGYLFFQEELGTVRQWLEKSPGTDTVGSEPAPGSIREPYAR